MLMVDVDRAVVARIKKGGKTFEILVDPEKAHEIRQGKAVGIWDAVAVDNVFSDVKKGLKASEHELKSIFGTADVESLFSLIIKEGDVPMTAKQLSQARDEKKKQIIAKIHRHGVDSRTGLPHPPQRIEAAWEEAKIRLDENKTAEQQLDYVVSQMRRIIPIKFETRQIEVIIPAQYASQSFHILKQQRLIKDEWLGNGSLKAVVEMPAGVTDEFFSQLNKIAHGQIESRVVKAF